MTAARQIVGYGLSDALPNIFPAPIVAKRAPTTADIKYFIGQLWIEPVNTSGTAVNSAWILTSVINNSANWALLEASGGTGTFSSLTVTPGPVSLTGTTTINTAGAAATNIGNASSTTTMLGTVNINATGSATTSVGNLNGASALTLDSGTGGTNLQTGATGTITLGSAAMTGTITVGDSTSGQSILIGNSAGANLITLGSNTAAATTTIQGDSTGATSAAINLSAGGFVGMVPGTVSAAAYAATLSTRVGAVTLTGQVLASAATQVLTITNTLCTTASQMFVTVANLGSNDAQLTITRIQPQAGSFLVTVKNNGAAALNGDIHVTFWIIAV